MPFKYDQYRSPYAQSIADMMLMGPAAQAQGIREGGNARANAEAARGQIWGGAIQNIGQAIAVIPQQIQQQKSQQQVTDLRAIQLNAAKKEERSATEFEAALKNPENYNADGSINDQAVTTQLRAKDVGAWQQWNALSAANQKNRLDTLKTLAEINKTNADTAEKQRQGKQAQADYLGRLSYNAVSLLSAKPADPLHARDTTLAGVARAAADGMISEADAKSFLMQTARATPEQLEQTFNAFIQPELRAKLEKESADTAKAKAEAERAAAEAANLKKYGRTTQPVETRGLDVQAAEALARGDMETYNRLKRVKEEMGKADDRPFAPIVIQTGAGPQLVDRGNATSRGITDASGATVAQAPTADMRNKAAARELVGKSINAIKALGEKVITKIGPAQRADAIKRGVQAVFGSDPEFRTYQDARVALAGNLAVAQQGSRPSDADIEKGWLPLVPDVYRDTAESATMKWELINTLSHTPQPSQAGVVDTQPKNESSSGPKVGELRLVNGQVGRWDGKGWLPVVPKK